MLKRVLTWGLKLALTAGSIWYLQKKVDLGAAWVEAKEVDPLMLAVALGLQAVQVCVCAGRWKLVLRAIGGFLPFTTAAELFMIGNFFGQVLPGAVGGDAIRMWRTHRAGLSLSTSINSVALERLITVFGLVLLVAATQPLMAGRVSDTSGAWIFPALTVGGVVGIGVLTLLDRMPGFLTHLKIVQGFMKLAGDSRRLFLSPRHVLPTLALTLFGHVNLALVVWATAVGMGAPATILDCIVLVPPVILVATLPISIAGWGVRETAMVTLMGFIGVPAAQAAAMSVLFGVLTVLISLPGGILWLFSKDRRAASRQVAGKTAE